MRRIKRRHDRPLLKTDDPAETLRRLIDERYPVYAQADLTVQSRDVPHDTIVDEIIAALRAHARPCDGASRRPARSARHDRAAAHPAIRSRSTSRSASAAYDIVIGRGLLATLGERIAKLRPGAKVAIVTDENGRQASSRRRRSRAVERRHRSRRPIVLPPGEGTKSFAMLERVCDALIARRIERGDLVVALGGGVVGDLAGFAAAVVRRGLDYVQVPTTLLAQVDSSVGGKTAINSRHGKNLIGAFHQPVLVVADTALLDTLPAREFRAGYAEVAKYGLLGDARVLRLARGQLAGRVRRRAGARARDRGELPRQGRDRARATSARPATACCSISATPSAMRSRPRPAFPTGCCTARRSRSAWRWRSNSRRGAGCLPKAEAERAVAPSCGGRPADPCQGQCPAAAAGARRDDGSDRPGQESQARQADLHPGARHRRRPSSTRDVDAAEVRAFPRGETVAHERGAARARSPICCLRCCCSPPTPSTLPRSSRW